MTTIAWDGKTIAADRLCSYHSNAVDKLVRMPDGSVCAGAGDSACVAELIAWIAGGASEKPTFPPDSMTVLQVFHGFRARYFQSRCVPFPVSTTFFAIGSGADYAMGAMAMGALACDAVKIAAQFDSDTGDGIDSITLGE